MLCNPTMACPHPGTRGLFFGSNQDKENIFYWKPSIFRLFNNTDPHGYLHEEKQRSASESEYTFTRRKWRGGVLLWSQENGSVRRSPQFRWFGFLRELCWGNSKATGPWGGLAEAAISFLCSKCLSCKQMICIFLIIMKIMSWNICGMGFPRKRRVIGKLISDYDLEVCFIQETKMQDYSDCLVLRLWKYSGR